MRRSPLEGSPRGDTGAGIAQSGRHAAARALPRARRHVSVEPGGPVRAADPASRFRHGAVRSRGVRRRSAGSRSRFSNGGSGAWTRGGCSARWRRSSSVSSATAISAYVAALMTTTVADVLVIYATLPFFAAGMAFAITGERASRRTLIAAGVAMVGIVVMVAGGLGHGRLLGQALALSMTVDVRAAGRSATARSHSAGRADQRAGGAGRGGFRLFASRSTRRSRAFDLGGAVRLRRHHDHVGFRAVHGRRQTRAAGRGGAGRDARHRDGTALGAARIRRDARFHDADRRRLRPRGGGLAAGAGAAATLRGLSRPRSRRYNRNSQ